MATITITTPLPQPVMGTVEYECPRCEGVGEVYHNPTRNPAMEQVNSCFVCDGTGWATAEVAAEYADFLAAAAEVA